MYCIYHSRDLDGWMSAAIVKKFYNENRYCSVCGHVLPKDWAGSTYCCGGMTLSNQVDFIGWDYGDPIPNIPKGERVIMADISFPSQEMLRLIQENDLIWIDHHISAINDLAAIMPEYKVGQLHIEGLQDHTHAACELTWFYFFQHEPMPEVVRLLGRYDCFGHKGTEEELKVLEFQYGARANMFDVETCYDVLSKWNSDLEHTIQTAGYQIYNYLCVEAELDYKNIFPINLAGVRVAAINKTRFNPINFGIDYHKNGYDAFLCFWYANGRYNFSLYNDNGEVDCSVICKQFGGGGHKGAAGFVSDNLDVLFGYAGIFNPSK